MALKRITDYTAATLPLAGTEVLELDVAGVPKKATAQDIANLSTALTNPMTTAGDIIIGGAAGAPTRLAIGADGTVLTVVAGAPAYAAAGTGGGYDWNEAFIRGIQSSAATGTSFLTGDYRAVSYNNGTAATTELSAPGVLMKTGTAVNGLVNLFATEGLRLKPVGEAIRVGFRVELPVLSDATESFSIALGFRTVITGAENDRITAEYTHSVNTGFWQLKSTAAGVASTANATVGPAAATATNIEIEINAAGTLVTLYVDGVSAATVNTNIPTVAIGVATQIYKTLGATERTARVHRIYRKA